MNQRIIKLPEVIQATALSRSTIYAFMNAGRFPRCIRLGQRAVGWKIEEITDWILQRAEERH